MPTWAVEADLVYDGPFRSNISAFLGYFGESLLSTESSIKAWAVDLEAKSFESTRLCVYEETANPQSPPICDQCRIAGWQQHPVCKKRYHFIIPASAVSSLDSADIVRSAPQAGHPAAVTDYSVATSASAFDSKSHLLHGLLHLNGCGHLLRVNGLEGGSAKLRGRQIMDLWDKLCILLRAREVTVEDVSSKAGMDLRVLYAVARRSTWYGQWGYGFCRGAFNISRRTWQRCMLKVSSTTIEDVRLDFEQYSAENAVSAIIDRYQVGQGGAKTLGSFLNYMLLCLNDEALARTVFSQKGHKVGGTTNPCPPKWEGSHSKLCSSSLSETRKIPPTQSRKIPEAIIGKTKLTKRLKTQPSHGNSRGPKVEPGLALPIKYEGLKPFAVTKACNQYSYLQVSACIAAIVAVLKVHQMKWVTSTELRTSLSQQLELKLLDTCLSLLSNTYLMDYAIFRHTIAENKAQYFLLAQANGEDTAVQLEAKHELQIPKYAMQIIKKHLIPKNANREAVSAGTSRPLRTRHGPSEWKAEAADVSGSQDQQTVLALLEDFLKQISGAQEFTSCEEDISSNIKRGRSASTPTAYVAWAWGKTRNRSHSWQALPEARNTNCTRSIDDHVKAEGHSESHQDMMSSGWQALCPVAPCQAKSTARDQVLYDLMHFYNCVLRGHQQAEEAGFASRTSKSVAFSLNDKMSTRHSHQEDLSWPPKLSLWRAELIKQVAVLRDTKHFLKDYNGNSLAPGAAGLTCTRVMCQMDVLDFQASEEDRQWKRKQHKLAVQPPPELLLLKAKCRLKDVQQAAQEAFSALYCMFDKFKVIKAVRLAAREKGIVSRGAVFSEVKVFGHGASTDCRLHHSGGLEDWTVSCSCGCCDDDGERMIECDTCGLWMHVRCQGRLDEATIPENFVCHSCRQAVS